MSTQRSLARLFCQVSLLLLLDAVLSGPTSNPTTVPTSFPTPVPTTASITTFDQLQASVLDNSSSVLSADLLLLEALSIDSVQTYVLFGDWHTLDASLGDTACISVTSFAQYATEASIQDLTVKGGAYSGIRLFGSISNGVSSATLTITRVTVHNCGGTGGGGIFISAGSLIAVSCLIDSNNSTSAGGGGVRIVSGFLAMTQTTLSNNRVVLTDVSTYYSDNSPYGGGAVSIESATVTFSECSFLGNAIMDENNVGIGGAIRFESGALAAVGLTFENNEDSTGWNDIAGDSSALAECSSSCSAGTFGSCTQIAPLCWANCDCKNCTAGKASNAAEATSSDVCSACAAGKVSSLPGASACSTCQAGSYAVLNETDTGAGQISQVLSGAKYCAPCPAGHYSPIPASIMCTGCEAGKKSDAGQASCLTCQPGSFSRSQSGSCSPCEPSTYSSKAGAVECSSCELFGDGATSTQGSTGCGMCLAGFFRQNEKCLACPYNAVCIAGTTLPAPVAGYWVAMERGAVQFRSSDLVKCTRLTCLGATVEDPCWGSLKNFSADESACDSNALQCSPYAVGPLCGSCIEGSIYVPSKRVCVACKYLALWSIFLLGLGFVASVFAWLLYTGRVDVPMRVRRWGVVGTLSSMDTGTWRVIISNYQIISSISVSLDISWPYPFTALLSIFNLANLDSFSFECLFKLPGSTFDVVFYSSVLPLLVVAANGIFLAVRINATDSKVTRARAMKQHTTFYIIYSYLTVPIITQRQLSALDCVQIAGEFVVRHDTQQSCETLQYHYFQIFDILSFFVFICIPVTWFALMWRVRKELEERNIERAEEEEEGTAEELSTTQLENTGSLYFLYAPYTPRTWWFECLELFRRLTFISFLPLITARTERKAALGMLFGLLSTILYRETCPFQRASTNLIATIFQYSIVLTYGAALAIATDLGKGLSPILFGAIMVLINGGVLALAVVLAIIRHRQNEQDRQQGRRILSTQELRIFDAVMQVGSAGILCDVDDREAGIKMQPMVVKKNAQEILERHLIDSKNIRIIKRVGAGAYGEVFRGSALGQPVAIKTMKDVSEKNAKAFRAEILLTATLSHPNIVQFIGASWGQDLISLILEWVPKGSLSDFLEIPKLCWHDPLLKLTTDVARGMVYLHGRSYFDEEDAQFKTCVVHRDLKPDNALITDFITAKITDFGTSRAMAHEDVTMTAVGTPLFSAPEILRGDHYDEKVDVYSFGLTLVDIATEEPILEFIGNRWKVAYKKKVVPKQPWRLIRSMLDDKWRPVSNEMPIFSAPSTINQLIVRCCSPEPNLRPSFTEILDELGSVCATEIEHGRFGRQSAEGRERGSSGGAAGSAQSTVSSVSADESWNLRSQSISAALEYPPDMSPQLSRTASLRKNPLFEHSDNPIVAASTEL